MKYFDVRFNIKNADDLKASAPLKAYYGGVVNKLNEYIYHNLEKGLSFFVYNTSNGTDSAAFSVNDRLFYFDEAVTILNDTLKKATEQNITMTFREITTNDYCERASEASRRELINTAKCKYLEHANAEFLWDLYRVDKDFKFRFEEKIITDDDGYFFEEIYDKSLKAELENIAKRKEKMPLAGNPAHYIISANSAAASQDMTEQLVKALADSGSLNGGRITLVTNISPMTYKENFLENLIENNTGGAVVIDMSVKLGVPPTEYMLVCRYLEKLVRKYINDCLFVFTYKPDEPGFSYFLLPEIKKFAPLLPLKEGAADRKGAVKYLQEMIKRSRFAEYAHLAREFMEQFPEEKFTQSEILELCDKFEPWCLGRAIPGMNEAVSSNDELMLDRNADGSACARLQNLIGLTSVKEKIERLISSESIDLERKKLRGKKYDAASKHMIFAGNPGTAKTTVAKMFAEIAREKGILKSGTFISVSGPEVGRTSENCTIKELFTRAKGGMLFIDEAYDIFPPVITELVAEMENRRDEVIVVFAGYSDGMKRFLRMNEGLKSRIPNWIDFPDYSVDELVEIFRLMLSQRGFAYSEDVVIAAREQFEKACLTEDFGNGRYVRNLIDRAVEEQSYRLSKKKKKSKKDYFTLIKDDIKPLNGSADVSKSFGKRNAMAELDEMIGLDSAKQVIKKAVAYYKMQKLYRDRGMITDRPAMHMSFTGNPGTAKTTVARLFARILREEAILPAGSFTEVGRADLVGKYTGHTAPLVKAKFKEARGGVLFIDEAYSLDDNNTGSFGEEAINTIVQEMENHREDIIVIFAGYPEQMKKFLAKNPGMSSRIAFNVAFEDYSVDELCGITKHMLSKRRLKITGKALRKLEDIYSRARLIKGYGNGRFVRKAIDDASMNLAMRVSVMDAIDITDDILTTIEECDISEDVIAKEGTGKNRRVGFRV